MIKEAELETEVIFDNYIPPPEYIPPTPTLVMISLLRVGLPNSTNWPTTLTINTTQIALAPLIPLSDTE